MRPSPPADCSLEGEANYIHSPANAQHLFSFPLQFAANHTSGSPFESRCFILDKGRRVAAGPIGDLTDEVVKAHLSV